MSLGPEVIPAPRVMAVNKFVRRFNYVLNEPPADGALVQQWAVAHGLDENGDEVLLVAHSIIGDRDEAIDLMSMKKSSFEKLVPLAVLGAVPNDTSALSTSESGLVEPPVNADISDHRRPNCGLSADEGFHLADRWVSGRKPIRQTSIFLRRALPVIPEDFADSYVKALQYLDAKFVLGDAGVEIAAVCFAIATVLDVSDDE